MSANTGKTRRAGQARCPQCKNLVPDLLVFRHQQECTAPARKAQSAKRKKRKT